MCSRSTERPQSTNPETPGRTIEVTFPGEVRVTLAEHRPTSGATSQETSSPELIAMARTASLRARGVSASSRPWERWLLDGATESALEQPWLVVVPEELCLEVVFGEHAKLGTARRVLLRLLADRWSVVVRVHPSLEPSAFAELGDLPVRIQRWDRM